MGVYVVIRPLDFAVIGDLLMYLNAQHVYLAFDKDGLNGDDLIEWEKMLNEDNPDRSMKYVATFSFHPAFVKTGTGSPLSFLNSAGSYVESDAPIDMSGYLTTAYRYQVTNTTTLSKNGIIVE